MSTSPVKIDALAVSVSFPENASLLVRLADGREISVPLLWFPRLADSTAEERGELLLHRWRNWDLLARLNEDLSVAGLLRG